MSTTNSTMFHVCVGDFDKRITYKVRSLVKMYEGGTLVTYSSFFFLPPRRIGIWCKDWGDFH